MYKLFNVQSRKMSHFVVLSYILKINAHPLQQLFLQELFDNAKNQIKERRLIYVVKLLQSHGDNILQK